MIFRSKVINPFKLRAGTPPRLHIGTPQVYLNGKELTGIRQGYTDVHYVLADVTLEQGKNTIKTVATYNGKEYTDEIEWNYTGEKKRSADWSEKKEEHAGW